MKSLFSGAFRGRTVLVTGHTGFKGSWLTIWLNELGARVVGYSLEEAPTSPSNFEVSAVGKLIVDVRGDIRNLEGLQRVIGEYRPEIIFHLAAQPIVLHSFDQPKLTFDTNAGGTVNVLEAARLSESVKVVVNATTDKVYENREWLWGYRENDRLGGKDPYSASKAMAELAIAAYERSYFSPEDYNNHGKSVAAVRAGNVIGGGDFAEYRLVPDCIRALMAGQPVVVRHPNSIRPWQHVLEPLSGYLALGSRLLTSGAEFTGAWNFGPTSHGHTVRELVGRIIELWGSGSWVRHRGKVPAPEMRQLNLSWEKASTLLKWRPAYSLDDALREIVDWFRAYQRGDEMRSVSRAHLERYVQSACDLGLAWTG